MVARWAVDMLLFLQAEIDLVTGNGGYHSAEDTDGRGYGQFVESTEGIPPWVGYLVWDIQMCVLLVYQRSILTRSHHRVLAKFGSILSTVEGLNYKSPRDIRQLGNPLKTVRTECVVGDTTTYSYGTGVLTCPLCPHSLFSRRSSIFPQTNWTAPTSRTSRC